MMAAGALIVALFGSCTLMSLSASNLRQIWGFAIVWAVFALGGVILIRAGWRTLRGERDRGDPDGG